MKKFFGVKIKDTPAFLAINGKQDNVLMLEMFANSAIRERKDKEYIKECIRLLREARDEQRKVKKN